MPEKRYMRPDQRQRIKNDPTHTVEYGVSLETLQYYLEQTIVDDLMSDAPSTVAIDAVERLAEQGKIGSFVVRRFCGEAGDPPHKQGDECLDVWASDI